jgi:endonuclease/exonuclease/phosphatase family metal-dependent hydrolase
MKNSALIAVVLLGISTPSGTPPRGDPALCLKVMTFNIRYGTAPDGENTWAARKDLVGRVIREHSPDLIGLQEALRFQIDELRLAFPEYGELGVGRDDGKIAGEYSALLFRSSSLLPDTGGTFWFSGTPSLPGSATWGNRIPRICTWAIFLHRPSGDTIAVFNQHWDHESQPSRDRSADLLVSTIRHLAPGLPVMTMGDFNAGEQNPALLTVKRSFRDSFRLVHPGDSVVGTFHAFQGTDTGDMIDHIFVNDRLNVTAAAIVRTAVHGRYPSDHFPVTATICFERP